MQRVWPFARWGYSTLRLFPALAVFLDPEASSETTQRNQAKLHSFEPKQTPPLRSQSDPPSRVGHNEKALPSTVNLGICPGGVLLANSLASILRLDCANSSAPFLTAGEGGGTHFKLGHRH